MVFLLGCVGSPPARKFLTKVAIVSHPTPLYVVLIILRGALDAVILTSTPDSDSERVMRKRGCLRAALLVDFDKTPGIRHRGGSVA